jgi:hypothetical protein
MSDRMMAFAGTLPEDFLARLFGVEHLKRGWHVFLPANDDAEDALHPAYIQALLKRRRSW